MDNSIYAILSGQLALRRKLDTVANNVANMSTTGFKKEHMQFDDIFKRLETEGKSVNFVYDVSSITDFSQGALTFTGSDLDTAIENDSVFAVETPNGVQYTRDGRFARNSEGELVMMTTGYKILDNAGGAIQIPADVGKIDIGRDGTISDKGNQISKLGLFIYDSNNMSRLSDGMYTSKAEAIIDGNPSVRQGFLEGSNVNAVKELTDLINVQRAYETAHNLMINEHDRIIATIDKLGRSTV
jgi:flagellar basal-body rod protein FlgF